MNSSSLKKKNCYQLWDIEEEIQNLTLKGDAILQFTLDLHEIITLELISNIGCCLYEDDDKKLKFKHASFV